MNLASGCEFTQIIAQGRHSPREPVVLKVVVADDRADNVSENTVRPGNRFNEKDGRATTEAVAFIALIDGLLDRRSGDVPFTTSGLRGAR